MRLSQYAKVYQLKNGHNVTATITHGAQTQNFKCGLVKDSLDKTTAVHGVDVEQNMTEIETVDFVNAQVGDKIKLEGGVNGKVHETHQTVLDESNIRLRFVPFKKVEKLTKIIIKHL